MNTQFENLSLEGFSQRLENLLSEHNTPASQLANSIGVSNATIYKLCNRNDLWGEGKITTPSSDNLLKISAFFQCSPFWLLFGKNFDFESKISEIEKSKITENIQNKDSTIENLKKENEKLKLQIEAYKRIFNSTSRKVTDLFEDFNFLQKEMNNIIEDN